MKSNITILTVLLALFSLNLLEAQDWTKLNGTQPNINLIYSTKSNPDRLFCGSDILKTDFTKDKLEFPLIGNGLRISTNGGNSFGEEMMNEEFASVYDVYQSKLNPMVWYAAIRIQGTGGIVISNDDGNTWDMDDIRCTGSMQIMKIQSDIIEGKEIFFMAATNISNGFVVSEDNFATCVRQESLTISSYDIQLSLAKPGLMFISGDHQSNHKVLRSYDYGETWLPTESGLSGLRILTIFPSIDNPAVIFAGADSLNLNKQSFGKGIYKSLDTGRTWQLVGAEGFPVYKISGHPTYARHIVAACGEGGVYVSSRYGLSWSAENAGLPQDAVVNYVFVPNWEVTKDGFQILAGVQDDGLYKSARIVSVEKILHNTPDISIYPQPASDQLIIDNLEIGEINIVIYDLLGNSVYSSTIYNNQTSNFNVELTNIPIGVYFIQLSNNNKQYREIISIISN